LKTKLFSLLSFFFLFAAVNAQQWNGLTLVAPYGTTNPRLVDTNGVTVKTWTVPGLGGYTTYMKPGGIIYRSVVEPPVVTPTFGGMTGQLQKIDYNNNVLWQYSYNNAQGILHHDIAVLPNGNILATAYDVKTGTAIPAAGSTSTASVLMSERILEIKPVGTNSAVIVWEWKMWDHLAQNTNSLAGNYYPSLVNHPELFNINHLSQTDFVHMNGIDYNPILDQIVFSSRYRSEWYVIDHSTTTAEAASHSGGNAGKGGDILYRWGNPQVYQAAAPQICFVTHDPHWIEEGTPNAGSIAGFNNGGQQVPTVLSTVDRIVTPRTNYTYSINLGSAFTPTTFTSRHITPVYNIITGNSEQFPNGNQAICLGTSGVVYEIDPAGNTIWSYNIGGITAQAHRYAPCYTLSPGLAQPSITVNGTTLQCTSAPSYQWYYNTAAVAGATNQSFVCPPGQSGNYLVKIKDANACAGYFSGNVFVNSPPLSLKDLTLKEQELLLYPNPSSGKIYVNAKGIKDAYAIEIFSLEGKLLLSEKNKSELDLKDLANGIYLLRLSSNEGSISRKISLER